MNAQQVLIVGAGPTGMTMAIELRRAGLNVRIVDKSDHPAQHSQALVVQARTLEQFQRYSIATRAVEKGRKLSHATFWSDGKKILSFGFDRIPSQYPFVLLIPQTETESLLNEKMRSLGVNIERRVELTAFTQQKDSVTSVLRHADGREESFVSRWIVGCDAAHSAVRKLANIPFEGAGVGLSFFLGDLELDGPDAPTDGLSLHLHHGEIIFMGPLSAKYTRLITVSHASRDRNDDRPLSIPDFQSAVDRAGVRVKIRSADWMTPFNVTDRQAMQYRAGNAFLAGDAAHIHSPVAGQGMNTGIQDAANLAWKLAAVSRGADEKILDSYDQERGAVGRKLLQSTERGLKMASISNPFLQYVRDTFAPLLAKSTTVQDIALGFISETAIEYRNSAVVADHGGDGHLHVGDRMPDLAISLSGQPSTLLRNWTDGRHFVLALNIPSTDLPATVGNLGSTAVTSLMTDDLDEDGRHLLRADAKILVVRPDGYVGFRAPVGKVSELSKYARQDALAG